MTFEICLHLPSLNVLSYSKWYYLLASAIIEKIRKLIWQISNKMDIKTCFWHLIVPLIPTIEIVPVYDIILKWYSFLYQSPDHIFKYLKICNIISFWFKSFEYSTYQKISLFHYKYFWHSTYQNILIYGKFKQYYFLYVSVGLNLINVLCIQLKICYHHIAPRIMYRS